MSFSCFPDFLLLSDFGDTEAECYSVRHLLRTLRVAHLFLHLHRELKDHQNIIFTRLHNKKTVTKLRKKEPLSESEQGV